MENDNFHSYKIETFKPAAILHTPLRCNQNEMNIYAISADRSQGFSEVSDSEQKNDFNIKFHLILPGL